MRGRMALHRANAAAIDENTFVVLALTDQQGDRKMLRWIFYIFLVLYLFALIIWLIGTFGLFGNEQDPLSGVFLVILGQPWTGLVGYLPEAIWPYAGALAPLANLGVIRLLWTYFNRN